MMTSLGILTIFIFLSSFNKKGMLIVGTQSICPLWGIFTSSQGLDLVACKAWHPHGFVLLTSVGMLIVQESHIA